MLKIADRPMFDGVDGRTSYSTQTNYDVKITFAHNQKNHITEGLQQGHMFFLDGTKPITVQYLNYLLATDPELQPDKISASNLVNRFKYMGPILAEDSVARGNLTKRSALHQQVFTVLMQGTCSVFDYWSSGGTGGTHVRRYDEIFFVLKRVTFGLQDIEMHYADNCKMKFPKKNNSVDQLEHWQVLPYNCRDRVPPLKAYGLGGLYWYVGTIHEYASIGYDAASRVNEIEDKTHSTQNLALLNEFDMGRQIQVYIHTVHEPRLVINPKLI